MKMNKMYKIIITETDCDILYLMLTEEQLRLLELLNQECLLKEDITFHVIKDNDDLFKIV